MDGFPNAAMRLPLATIAIGLALAAACRAAPPETADLVLTGGRVVTLDASGTEAEALAARDGLIVAVGTDETIAARIGPDTRVVELDGRLAVPGFIEGHGHLLGLGRSAETVDLSGASDWGEVIERVALAARSLPPGTWIEGRGWHQEKWERGPERTVAGFPVHDELSLRVPDHPAWLTHASGHAAIVNAAALERAGIDASTGDPEGGRIERHPDGRPTGVLHETAEALVAQALDAERGELDPVAKRRETERLVGLAVDEALRHGVTSFHDAGSSFETVSVLRDMAERGDLGVRMWIMLSEDDAAIEREIDDVRIVGFGDHHLTVRAVKRYADGALGNRGAWMLEPYDDAPETSGIPVTPVADLERAARVAVEHDLQLCVHAIGDRANREVLDLYERVAGDGLASRRFRIEHAQHLHPDDIPRFGALGVVAAMQGVHCVSDGPWVEARIGGDRARAGAYAWRALLDSGAVVSNGTDVPVEPIDPIASFHALVTREAANGEPFYPEQAMSRVEALRSMTLSAAYAAFEEDLKGSLEPGKLADVTVVSHDILEIPDGRIRDARVEMTIVGGEVRYERED